MMGLLFSLLVAEKSGFKLADDTRGERFDPTSGNRTPSQEGIARARHFLSERFPELAKAIREPHPRPPTEMSEL